MTQTARIQYPITQIDNILGNTEYGVIHNRSRLQGNIDPKNLSSCAIFITFFKGIILFLKIQNLFVKTERHSEDS